MIKPVSSGKNGRSALTAEQRASKVALAKVVKDIGGLDEAETHTRVSSTQIQRYCSVNHPDCFAPADVIADLEAVASHPWVTERHARQLGRALIAHPKVQANDCATLHAALSQSMDATTHLHRAILEAIGDGKVTAEEAKAAVDLAMALAEDSLRMAATLKRIAEEC